MPDRRRLVLAWAFARLHVAAFAAANAAMARAALFRSRRRWSAKGAPPGVAVGPHLAALGA